MDEQLKGEDGLLVYQKDAIGYSLPGTEKIEKNAVNGNDVYLTINKEVQSALESALQSTLDENSATLAWGVVMEVKTGKILAYGGYPTFDLNKRDIESYLDIPSMYNFEPGSVMKPFTYVLLSTVAFIKLKIRYIPGVTASAMMRMVGSIVREDLALNLAISTMPIVMDGERLVLMKA